MLGPDRAKGEATWALTGIAHRIDREVFAEELRNSPEPEKVTESDVESFVDQVFKNSFADVERHFEVFYDTDGSSLSGFAPRQTHALIFGEYLAVIEITDTAGSKTVPDIASINARSARTLPQE